MSATTTHFVVIVRASAAPKASFTLRADAFSCDDEVVRFRRDGQTVHVLPAADFARAIAFESDKAARDHLAALRAKRHGAATIHVDESASPAPRSRPRTQSGDPSRGAVAEALTFRIQE